MFASYHILSSIITIVIYWHQQMSFLDEIWKTLQSRKTNQPVNPNLTFPEPYVGYRIIPIQNLDRIRIESSSFNDGRQVMSQYGAKKIIYFRQNTHLTRVSQNGFFSCFYEAYMHHGDIRMKPDEIWHIIMMWFSKYVNDNAEQLRKAFVTHEGKKKLSVMMQARGEDIGWQGFFRQIINSIKENTVAKTTQKLACNFSCTSDFDRVFSTAAIMCGLKKYFDFEGMGAGCGIVRAHMAGRLQDWQGLVKKLQGLLEYDVDGQLKRYINGLRPVLEQFVQTYKGFAHLQFWNNIYHERKDPNIPTYTAKGVIDGWLIKFFTTDNQLIEPPKVQLLSVDVNYKNLATMQEKKLTLLGATQGFSVEEGHIYRPQFAYGIVENQPSLFVIKRAQSEQVKKKREKGFVMPTNAQIVEMRKKKIEMEKMPIKEKHMDMKLIYGVGDKLRASSRKKPRW